MSKGIVGNCKSVSYELVEFKEKIQSNNYKGYYKLYDDDTVELHMQFIKQISMHDDNTPGSTWKIASIGQKLPIPIKDRTVYVQYRGNGYIDCAISTANMTSDMFAVWAKAAAKYTNYEATFYANVYGKLDRDFQ